MGLFGAKEGPPAAGSPLPHGMIESEMEVGGEMEFEKTHGSENDAGGGGLAATKRESAQKPDPLRLAPVAQTWGRAPRTAKF